MEYRVIPFARWMAKALVPGNLYDEESQRRTAFELVFQRLDPIKIKGVGHLSGNFRAAAPASFGVHRVTLERKSCPLRCDIILHGSVITARDVPGAMKDRVVQLCGDTGWPETFDKTLQSPGGHGSYETTNREPFRRGRHRGHRECHRHGNRVGGAHRDALRNAVPDDACVRHPGTEAWGTSAHRRRAPQKHTWSLPAAQSRLAR